MVILCFSCEPGSHVVFFPGFHSASLWPPAGLLLTAMAVKGNKSDITTEPAPLFQPSL